MLLKFIRFNYHNSVAYVKQRKFKISTGMFFCRAFYTATHLFTKRLHLNIRINCRAKQNQKHSQHPLGRVCIPPNIQC